MALNNKKNITVFFRRIIICCLATLIKKKKGCHGKITTILFLGTNTYFNQNKLLERVHQKIQLKCGKVEKHEGGGKSDISNDVSKKRELRR